MGLDLGEGAAHHREVLGEDRHPAPVDLTQAGDDPIARIPLLAHAEVGDIVGGESAELLKGLFVQEMGQPLARGELAPIVLLLDPLRASAPQRLLAKLA